MFDISDFQNEQNIKTRYKKQLDRLLKNGIATERFQKVTDRAIKNINNGIRSFCIYGDPQSGKTEMMIALTAKLLDEDHKIIIILLNDNLDLLTQNLERFAYSGIDPTPQNFTDIIRPEVKIGKQEVIFCKKNSKDLQRIIEKVDVFNEKIIIDDEGDYATPNAKINKNEQTKINQLVERLLGNGIYIGVTATPARLNLNNTFNNASANWIYFEPHNKYTGQDTFFPISGELKYSLRKLPQNGDYPSYLINALLRFLVNAAILNQRTGRNYCMLVHTSGKKVDHSEDYKKIIDTFDILSDKNNKIFSKYVEQVFNISKEKLNNEEKSAKELTTYILDNIGKKKVVLINSDSDRNNTTLATNPAALFTVAIGGNIISRGITFENLLSMFFTRDVKHKIQQDTYIQRARMFGARGDYLKYFELTIPEHLYLDWHRCFIFHRLSLQSAMAGNAPVWIEDSRVKAVAPNSIDKASVEMDSGEMSFEIFNYSNYSKEIESMLITQSDPFKIVDDINKTLGNDCLPKFLIDFICRFSQDGINSLAIHQSTNIKNRSDVDKEIIYRSKGLIGNSEMEKEKYPHAIHHIKIFFNSQNNKARVFYRYVNSVKFLKNLKNI